MTELRDQQEIQITHDSDKAFLPPEVTEFALDVKQWVKKSSRNPTCRQYSVAAYKALESSGIKPVIAVKLNEQGMAEHCWVEIGQLAIDFVPGALVRSLLRGEDPVKDFAARISLLNVLILDKTSDGYRQVLSSGIVKTVSREDALWNDEFALDDAEKQVMLDRIPPNLIDKASKLKELLG
ncbi:MAG: lasso peptide biosynthesis protein [Candidatus Blackburnbacteria bacterium]|nr:lasso peptide biosynthesis protein [Candidatus Blackburnbacteria bacterium]